jgi:hypothetical protein
LGAATKQTVSFSVEESKDQTNFGCKFCGIELQQGKIFQHESTCAQKPKTKFNQPKPTSEVSNDRQTGWRQKSEAFKQ